MGQPQSSLRSFSPKNNLFKAALTSQNPMELLQTFIQQNQNPEVQKALNDYHNSGMTPRQFFLQYAKQKSTDPNQFLQSLLR